MNRVKLVASSTPGIIGAARIGTMTIIARTIACDSSETGTVYHFRLPIEIDGRVTSPNRSRGMNYSPSACIA